MWYLNVINIDANYIAPQYKNRSVVKMIFQSV